MRNSSYLIAMFASVALAFCTGGLGPEGEGEDAGSPSHDAGPRACTPGATESCACPGGSTRTQTCNTAGTGFGACEGCPSTATCSSPVGTSCTTDSQCCAQSNGDPTYCTGESGTYVCRAACTQDRDCVSGCCATRTDGVRVCASASYCACSVSVNGSCTSDAQCCPQTNGDATYCTTDNGVSTCRAACTTNSDCVSGCCTPRTDGVRVCAAANYCDPCAAHSNCASCTGDTACGWCDGSRTCRTGGASGSNDGVCTGSDWAYVSSQCT